MLHRGHEFPAAARREILTYRIAYAERKLATGRENPTALFNLQYIDLKNIPSERGLGALGSSNK